MPRGSKPSVEGEDLVELRALRQELDENRLDTINLRQEVTQIKLTMGAMNNKHDEIGDAVDDMQVAVGNISSQLSSISAAIDSLRTIQATVPQQPENLGNSSRMPQKSPTFQQSQRQPGELTEALKQRLLQEQEKSNYIDLVTSGNLPPINTGRRSAPPGFAGIHPTNHRSLANSPQQAPTPAFNKFQRQQPRLQQLWEGYARDYEKRNDNAVFQVHHKRA